jgi:hypothetical protein
MINRAALLLRYKQPAVDWINESDPYKDSPGIELDRVNEERNVYLIPDRAAADEGTVRVWVELNHAALFENELAGWYEDESLMPSNLSLELFDEWFDVECHSIVLDTSDEPIIEETYDEDDQVH